MNNICLTYVSKEKKKQVMSTKNKPH